MGVSRSKFLQISVHSTSNNKKGPHRDQRPASQTAGRSITPSLRYLTPFNYREKYEAPLLLRRLHDSFGRRLLLSKVTLRCYRESFGYHQIGVHMSRIESLSYLNS